MQGRKTPGLRRIRLLMLLSIVLLGGFLGYWLRQEYRHEREQLQTELNVIFSAVNTRLDDSLLMRNLVKPLQEEIAAGGPQQPSRQDTGTATSSLRISMRFSNDSNRDGNGNRRLIARHSRILRNGSVEFHADSISRDSFESMQAMILDSSGTAAFPPRLHVYESDGTITSFADSTDQRITRGIRLLLQTLSGLPGAVDGNITSADSALVRTQFDAELRKRRISGRMHWAQASGKSRSNMLPLTGELLHRQNAFVTGYEPNLLRRVSPQLGFSILLLCLTALAFGVTFRALRSQMQLAAIRNDFISNMSHELKTPVSTVKVALEAISEPAVLADRQLAGEYLGMASLELNRLELLINQALQSALLEGGRLRMDKAPIDLGETLDQMSRIMQPRFQQCSGTLSLQREGTDFRIEADQLHLQGVFVNILDNALKYAGPAPVVGILLTGTADDVVVDIRDQGPGIPAEFRAKVFDKFFRVPRGNEHSVKGYGLGLNYAAEVLRAHGGSISVSEAPGGGCSFRIRIPRYQP